jgi:hypothetical protein
MPGPAPKDPAQRRRRNKPARGEWQPAPGVGWQHKPFPAPPDGLLEPSRAAWETWFRAWFAAHWTPDDLPGLRQLILLYDHCERGAVKAADRSMLIRFMDSYGITPRGQVSLRWTRPKPDEKPAAAAPGGSMSSSPYGHLRVVEAG